MDGMKRLVFLHIPKTAGQTVHFEFERVFGKDVISPIRVHTQSPATSFPEADRYQVFSGHIDWHDIDAVPAPKVVFSVLRDPRERLASFFLYLRSKRKGLSDAELAQPQHRGIMLASTLSVDDYFCLQDLPEREFIDDHYDNFYVSYFASRRMRGRKSIAGLTPLARISLAVENARAIDLVCMTDRLDLVESLIEREFGKSIKLQGRYANVGPKAEKASRFEALLDEVKDKRSIDRIQAMCSQDDIFLKELGL